MNRMNRTLMTAILLGGATSTYAVPVQLSAGDIVVGYDLDDFYLHVDGASYDHDPSVFSITPLANGMRLGFGGLLNIYATSYFTYSSQTKMADYSALFSLSSIAGKTITGFTITYAGGYSVETPGSAAASGVGLSVGGSDGGGPFSISSSFTGSAVPTLSGQLSATGDISYINIIDHYQEELVGYQQVVDYCDVDNPDICQYISVPVYEQDPVYRVETDLGEATVYLDSITISANVAPVPLPASGLLFSAGLLGMGLQKIRRQISAGVRSEA